MRLHRANTIVPLFVVSLACLMLGAFCPVAHTQTQVPEWKWADGTDILWANGQYVDLGGNLGQTPQIVFPGARVGSSRWTDTSGNFWLFGGQGLDANSDYYGYALNDLWEFSPSTQEWNWIGGSSSVTSGLGQPGVYGQLADPAQGNIPGGRGGAATWADASGNFWLFGGYGIDSNGAIGLLNDLWQFSPSTQEWAWMGGSSTMSYIPAEDTYGRSGQYGSLHSPSAGNIPGGRGDAVTWVDTSGNFWLFGGFGIDSTGTGGYLNDLWEFNPATGAWTWMAGSSTVPGFELGQPGIYGQLDTFAAGNIPGGRENASAWTDASGNFWLFGGVGDDSASTVGLLNDLWEFNPSTGTWAWMGGNPTTIGNIDDSGGHPGVYGTLGSPASGNIPGSRNAATGWTDASANFWLFGGQGIDSAGTFGYLNDLWEFNPATGAWTWMGGSSTIPSGDYGPPGVYGTLGVPSSANIPGGRYAPIEWTGKGGSFWIFAGEGVAADAAITSDGTNFGMLNDLWEAGTDLPYTPQVVAVVSGTNLLASQPIKVAVSVSGGPGIPTPTGTVKLTSSSYASSAVQLSNGSATINIPANSLSAGTDVLSVVYTPDSASSAVYSGASGLASVTVIAAPAVTVTPSAATIMVSQALQVTVAVSGGADTPTPTGTVTLYSGSYAAPTVPLSNGSATFTIPGGSLSLGNDTITALYTPGEASFNIYIGASGTAPVAVTGISPIVTVTPAMTSLLASQSLPVTVTVSGSSGSPTATGSVMLTSGSYSSGAVTLSSGADTVNIPANSLSLGSDTLSALYMPDTASAAYYAPGSGTASVTVRSTPSLTWTTPSVISYGTALSATQLNASSAVAGSFVYSPAAGTVLGVGSHTVTATFTPTDAADYTGATASVSVTVTQASPTNLLVSSANPAYVSNPVTFTATVASMAGTPTGTVSFYDGTTLLGSGTLSAGMGTYRTSSLMAGAHLITAVYSGDANFVTVTSSAVAETIENFTLAPPTGGGSATANPGGQATYTLNLAPPVGTTFAGPISFSVTGLPSGATAVFSPATIAAGAGATAVTMTVTLPSASAVHPLGRPFGGGMLPVVLGLILLPFAGRLRLGSRRLRGTVWLIVLGGAALAAGLTSCGGGGGSGGGGSTPPPQSYTLTITATSGSLSNTTTVTLTVE